MVDDLSPYERERLRDLWEPLEPNVDLESSMVDIARDVPSSRGRTIPLWLPAVGLAALLLLAVFSRRDPDPVPTGEVPAGDDGGEVDRLPKKDDVVDELSKLADLTSEPEVWTPPSINQAERARERNARHVGGLRASDMSKKVYIQVAAEERPIHGIVLDAIPGQTEAAVHRLVEPVGWDAANMTRKPRLYASRTQLPDMRPPAACVGIEFFKVFPHAQKVKNTITVEVRTPETPYASTRLLMRVDHGFPGFAVVPNDVARALGLTQFEIPGGAAVTHRSNRKVGYRALAVLALPDSEEGKQGEVFVPRAQRPQLASVRSDGAESEAAKQVVALYGPTPFHIAMTQAISYDVKAGVRYHGRTSMHRPTTQAREQGWVDIPIEFASPASLHLDWNDGRSLWVPPIDLGGDWGDDTSLRTLEQEWEGHAVECPPGSTFIASTVWRGNRASVGPAGCAFGSIDKDGMFKAVFLEGHDMRGLRVCVTRPDGSRIFADILANEDEGQPAPTLRGSWDRPVLVATGTRLVVRGTPFEATLGKDPVENARSLQSILSSLETRVQQADAKAVGVLVDSNTPWMVVHRLIRMGARLGIRRYPFQLEGVGIRRAEPELIRLPTTSGHAKPQVFVRMAFRDSKRGVSIEWHGAHKGAFSGSEDLWVTADLIDQWKDVLARTPNLAFVLDVEDPLQVPAARIHDCLRGLREAGIDKVIFRARGK